MKLEKKNVKLKKKRNRPSLLFWMLLPLALVIWSLWPQPNITKTMQVNQDFLDATLLQSCPLLKQLSQYEFEVKIPEHIWKEEQANLTLNLRAPEGWQALSDEDRNACSLGIETDLEVNDLSVQPGETLIEPFVGEKTQSFLFIVSPRNSTAVDGKLWIYSKAKPAGSSTDTQTPLFSIPVAITQASILGLPPKIVRYGCVLVMLILLAFFFHGKLNNRK